MARQPFTAMAATWSSTSAETPSAQVSGAGSSGNSSSIRGIPRANHSATISNSACANGAAVPLGMPAMLTNSLRSACQPAPNARSKVYSNQGK